MAKANIVSNSIKEPCFVVLLDRMKNGKNTLKLHLGRK